ncbi:hypothetical protein vBPpSSYP_164 [Pseudomonas phage vB_PpS_SYP]|nr:hypothetical protein vBPpSSYP_164 [Pseudomonas phage vB_PpS_SYP]
MKVYQVYSGAVVLYTTDTLDYASYLRDWCAAEYENDYRNFTGKNIMESVTNQIRYMCDKHFFVMQVGVLRG